MNQAGRALRLGSAAATAGLMFLAGCGSTHPTGAATGPHAAGSQSGKAVKNDNGTDLVAGAGKAGPPGGSRAQARMLARKLLPMLILPKGTVRLEQVPPQLRGRGVGLGARDVVGAHRQFALRPSLWDAARFFRTHVPAGMRFQSNGSDSGIGQSFTLDLADVLRSLPAGIYQAEIDLSVVRAPGGGSLMLADAQVVWSPARSKAEYIDPARFASVVLTAQVYYPKRRTVTRRVTSRSVITELAGLLNGMQASPDLAMPCPAPPVIYRAGFAVTADGRPSVVVDSGSCQEIDISGHGHGQPPLVDHNGSFGSALNKLLDISLPS